MNSEQKTRAISKLATLSANSISPSSFVTELVHNVFQECNPTGAFLARLTREGNLKMLAAYGYSDASLAGFDTMSVWDATPATDSVREKKLVEIGRAHV